MKQMKEIILTLAAIVFAAGIVYIVAQKLMNKQNVKIQHGIHTGVKDPGKGVVH